MPEKICDVAIIGGGPAGLAAAYSARAAGAERVIIIERDRELGGILQQCIHNGFGLHRFGQQLTGPGYADRYIKMVEQQPGIEVLLDSMVLEITSEKILWVASPRSLTWIDAKAIVLAMGCRERTRGAIRIPGNRPAGIFTAGAAQRMVNMEGYLPGKNIVILGSGDIGLIMARRMTLEGAKVHAVLEIMPHSNGLTRNIVQCLEDYDIPLYLSHTITAIHGHDRLTGVTCAAVDASMTPLPGTEFTIDCDCLLLSVGLIPENELSQMANIELDRLTGGPNVDQWRQTKIPGFFAAGNVVQVHDLVDWVSAEADIAGRSAALYAQGRLPASDSIAVKPGDGLRTVVPQRLSQPLTQSVQLFCRCLAPARRVTLEVRGADNTSLYRKRLPIVKPSEMIVAEVPAAALAKQREINVVITQGW